MKNSGQQIMSLNVKHGEIWIADLNPRFGAEPGKLRPILVWQNQALLDAAHPSTIILPLTTRQVSNAMPLRVRIEEHMKLLQDSDILIDQIRAIDNQRISTGPIGRLAGQQLIEVEAALNTILQA